MLDVINWMREYNTSNPSNQISFWGCDISADDQRRYGNLNARDQLMAGSCIDILGTLNENQTAALWSHNFHTRHLSANKETVTQGEYLKRKLDNKYFPIITLFNQGGFNALNFDEKTDKIGPLESFNLKKAPQGTYEFELAKQNSLFAILQLDKDYPKMKVRETGSMFDPAWTDEKLVTPIDLTNSCDGIIWINKVTPATALKYKQ